MLDLWFSFIGLERNPSKTKSQRPRAGIPSVRETASLILNPQDLLQIRSLETVLVCMLCCGFSHNNNACIHLYEVYEIKRAARLSQAFAHFVTARASLFTDL